jgi:lysophospholipase L1-like esterase
MVGGQFTSLAVNAIGYFDGTPIEFIIDVKGSLIQVFIDNDPIFSVTDSDLSSGGVALYCQDKALFDNVLVTDAGMMPRVFVASPLAYMIASSDTSNLSVSADVANLPDGARVEFLLNGGNSQTDTQTPFQSQFNGLASGEYTVTAILRDADGNELYRDTNQAVGVGGGFNIAVGDSITNGSGDRNQLDNTSDDGRIVGRQGYEADLNNQLTDTLGLPQIVFNEGIPGDTTSANLLIRIDSILSRHPEGNNVFLLLGTNDATQSVASDTYFNQMQDIVDIIVSANMTVRVAQVPPIFDIDTGEPNNSANTIIQGYNSELENLTNALPGPDFYTFFLDNAGLFADHLHPNSLGHTCLARLWHNSITGANNAPFILGNLQAPDLYQQNLLETGNEFYIDQSYTLESIPAEVSSGIWIMTANGDASDTSATFISFDLDRAATVYVAYDGRSGTVFPTWLTNSFVDTGLQVDTTVGVFDLFSRTATAGVVNLGGNQANGGTGVFNYFVVVVSN